MKILVLIIASLLTAQIFGQKASFKELKFKPRSEFYNSKQFTIVFPLVTTNNPKIDRLINLKIKEDVFQSKDGNKSVQTIIKEHINEYGLINLSYEVTYNSYGLLSFSISGEGCGAYCSNWNNYLTFDLLTGAKFSINDIILKNKLDSFKNIVRSNKVNILLKFKEEEKQNLNSQEIDSTTYEWIISQVDDNCINQFSIENFSVSSNSIEIIDPCEFPHAIRSRQPIIELKYPYNSIRKFLTPKFQRLLR